MKPIVIFGAGGFGREVLELVRDVNEDRNCWEVVGFLTDDEKAWGTEVNGVAVVGGHSWLAEQSSPIGVVLGIGSPAAKARVVARLAHTVEAWPTVIHPNVVCSKRVELARGVVITAGSILTTDIVVSEFAMINLACTVGHDCRLGRFVTLSPGVNVSGYVQIGEGCDVGTGAAIVPGRTIGEWSILGAGAVANQDLPPNCTAVGVPARVIKERRAGWQHESHD